MSQNKFKNKCVSSGRHTRCPNSQNIALKKTPKQKTVFLLYKTKCLVKTV